jgi:hypothetical protein
MEGLASAEVAQDVVDDVLVRMELGDVVANVLILRVAKQFQFGVVGPKDGPVGSDPVEGDGRILHKVSEVLLARAQERILRFKFSNTGQLGH